VVAVAGARVVGREVELGQHEPPGIRRGRGDDDLECVGASVESRERGGVGARRLTQRSVGAATLSAKSTVEDSDRGRGQALHAAAAHREALHARPGMR